MLIRHDPLEIPAMSESVFADRIVQNLLDTDYYNLDHDAGGVAQLPQRRSGIELHVRSNSEDSAPVILEFRDQIEQLAEPQA